MFAILEFWDLCLIASIVIMFAGGAAGASAAVKKRKGSDRQRLLLVTATVERLEKKLNLLLQKAGIEYAHLDLPSTDVPKPAGVKANLPEGVAQALREGMISRAAELYEKATGKPHQEALKYLEGVYERKEF